MYKEHVQIKETPCGYTYMHKMRVQIEERKWYRDLACSVLHHFINICYCTWNKSVCHA